MFIVYWRDRSGNVYSGYIKARTYNEAFDFAKKILGKDQYVTSVYRVPNGFRSPEIPVMNERQNKLSK